MKRTCETCGGRGYIEVGVGLNALQDRYPELPIREMVQRGWLCDVGDGDDVARCDAAFLEFWGVESHDEVQKRLHPSPVSTRRSLVRQPK